ncbi:carbohydrate ABC transporter membrane protein 2 (CUT1 family) [Paenibacillus taihuensis]|uniref:Carbohydrate ABC transporter membrane protein 2 (CUT1 family) n=1 Tax=Paenibacillus taihuensis TaxID=1156355 RepID=A0A3D9S6S5_9BACL|nr:carbohydrate ABC transporter permease [Paenibacillus taihuensis]REE86125.1 carbohydrate ABC transporter membrane protein 2 (CUT1 family) [Paenibacillus taihuensis]
MSSATTGNARSYFESRRTGERIRKTIMFLLLAGAGLVFVVPFWWMISTSLKTMDDIMQYPPAFIPKHWHFQNYLETWTSIDFPRFTLNSLTIATIGVVGHVISNTFVAYGFAKIKFRGRNLMFSIVLSTMIIPGFVTLIPQYILFAKIHWVGTYLPLTVPGFFGNAFQIFLLRQFFLGIPNDLIEAAKIDGANHFYIWRRIMVPLAKPAVITIALTTFQGAWNDFLGPVIYLNKESTYTLQIALQMFKASSGLSQWHYLMAGSVIVLLPIVVMFFVFQKFFIEGMNISSGTKG